MRQQGEPSVEEILESIKRVIARDNRETAQVERRHRESAGLDAETLLPPIDESEEGDEIFELGEAVEIDEREEREERDEAAPRLTTERTAGAMRESLAALAMLAEPGAQPQIVRSGETSLEGLVRDLLRPMLAEWLESHLPGIVDRMVQAEIARIAGKKG
jgi:cell pole-organizing protein PopZ